MLFLKKNRFFIYFTSLIGIHFFVSLCTFIFLGFYYLPKKDFKETQSRCFKKLEDKSYQLKQFILENTHNSSLWASLKSNSFFDSRWISISFYEHNGSDWILKNFQLNGILMDLYKMSTNDFIKFEQTLQSSHPDSKQITTQEGKILNHPILVLESANSLKNPRPHMLRVSIMHEQISSLLDSNEECPIQLFDSKGDFLFLKNPDLANNYVKIFNTQYIPENNAFLATTPDELFYTKKVLKDLSLVQSLSLKKNNFSLAFAQTLALNSISLLVLTILALAQLKLRLHERIKHIKGILHKFAMRDFDVSFDPIPKDELSSLDESLSEIKERARRKP